MSQLQSNLGYGKVGIVELDQFTRIMGEQFYDDEEVRFLRPTSYINAFEYCGVAIAGSLTSDSVWTCLRKSYDSNGKASRCQIRFNVIWDQVTQGWN